MIHVQSATSKKSVKGEDFCFCAENLEWHPVGRSSALTYHLYAVFDGHGSQAVANYCKSEFASVFAKHLSASVVNASWTILQNWEQSVAIAFKETFKELDAYACDRFERSGTTASVVCVVHDDEISCCLGGRTHVTVANVGDSNVYVDAGLNHYMLNEDHRLACNGNERKRIVESGGEVKKQTPTDALRLWPGGLMMSRTLGDRDAIHAIPAPSIRSAALSVTKQVGARVIIASDGLWDAVSAKMATTLAKKKKTHVAALLLRQTAVKRAGKDKDDITIVVVDLSTSADVGPFDQFETASLSSTQRRERSLSFQQLLPLLWATFEDPVPEMESIVDLSASQEPEEPITEIAISDTEEAKIAVEPEVPETDPTDDDSEGWQDVIRRRPPPESKRIPPTSESTNKTVSATKGQCHRFMKGGCKRGSACKYSHITETSLDSTRREEQQVIPRRSCFKFAKGRCTRGDNCKFEHLIANTASNVKSNQLMESPEEVSTTDSSLASGTIGSKKKNKKCFAFKKGKCKKGDQCPFKHVASQKPQAVESHVSEPLGEVAERETSTGSASKPRPRDAKDGYSVYISGLVESHSKAAVREYLQQYGNVVQLRFRKKFNRKSREKKSICIASFESTEDVEKILSTSLHLLNGDEIQIQQSKLKAVR